MLNQINCSLKVKSTSSVRTRLMVTFFGFVLLETEHGHVASSSIGLQVTSDHCLKISHKVPCVIRGTCGYYSSLQAMCVALKKGST